MEREKIVKTISRIVSALDILACIGGIVIAGMGAIIINSVDEISNGGSSDVAGELFVGLGVVFGALIGYFFVFAGIITFFYFLIPSIEGVVLWIKCDKKLEEGPEVYFRAFKKDGILKLIFNGIPMICWVGGCVSEYSMANIGVLAVAIVPMAVVGLSIYQIIVSAGKGE